MQPEREVEIICSILNAWRLEGTKHEVPWGVTRRGWEVYSEHPSIKVLEAVIHNPRCPKDILQKLQKATA